MKGLSILFLLILSWIFLLSACKAQDLPAASNGISVDIAMPASLLEVDRLAQVYLVTPDNELRKYDPQGNLLLSYSNDVLGQLAYLDVTNPLKLILFYPDFQMVISLDNALSEIGRYDLQAFGYTDIEALGLSNDNHLWIYDPEEFSIKKIDEQGRLILESFSLVSENLGRIQPISLKERHNKVYLNDPAMGILEFDNFGQFNRVIPVQAAKAFQPEAGGLIYFDGEALYRYNPFLFESKPIEMDSELLHQSRTVRLTKDNLYLLLDEGVKLISRKE